MAEISKFGFYLKDPFHRIGLVEGVVVGCAHLQFDVRANRILELLVSKRRRVKVLLDIFGPEVAVLFVGDVCEEGESLVSSVFDRSADYYRLLVFSQFG